MDKKALSLTIASLGIVFGDIGTSPLYAFRECFSEHYHLAVTSINILGLLSLIFYSLFIVVYIKYMAFILKADNKGEGGGLALFALAFPKAKVARKGLKKVLFLLGLFGAALLLGDGMITPAISVLSAVEGIKIASPDFEPLIIPMTCVILVGLFSLQKKGSQQLGLLFGPILLVYFSMLAILGLPQIIKNPEVLKALSPWYAWNFFVTNGLSGLWVLGSVFLAVTGCEALYADMGHFGRKPIKKAWSLVVFPTLLINYFGQGALLMQTPQAIENPFYYLAPGKWVLLVGAIATIATIIASQALISGVFSLANQAILMGFSPRLEVIHTSSEEKGQIYLPLINIFLMLSAIGLVIGFGSSSALAGAYGIGVALTMTVTTVMVLYVAKMHWNIRPLYWYILGALFIFVDFVFLIANFPKILSGGWFPLFIGGVTFILMTTWKRGRRILSLRLRERSQSFESFLQADETQALTRVPGTAFFMTTDPEVTPHSLIQNAKHNHVLHERTIILSVITHDIPRVASHKRIHLEQFPNGFFRARCFFGFMESPNMNTVLEVLKEHKIYCQNQTTTFFLGRETIIAQEQSLGMPLWRKWLFSLLSKNATRATKFFKIPADQVVEIGSVIEL